MIVGLVLGLRGENDGYSDNVRDGIGREDGELGGYSHVSIQAASKGQASEVSEGSGAVSPYWVLADARLVPLPSPVLPSPRRTPTPSQESLATRAAGSEEEGSRDSGAALRGIICSFDWPQGCAYWIGVAYCESGLRPYAVGYGGRYVGLFQVWLGHGYGADWLKEPRNNTLVAWELSGGGVNTSPWPACRWQ